MLCYFLCIFCIMPFITEWYWRCVIHQHLVRTAAVLSVILSATVVWSEVTFFNKKPVLSIFANFLSIARENYDYFTIEVSFYSVCLNFLCILCILFAGVSNKNVVCILCSHDLLFMFCYHVNINQCSKFAE